MSVLAGTLAGLSFAYAGMASLCLAMDRHHGQVFGGRDPSVGRRRVLRIAGALLLALALAACLPAWGSGVGWVVWLGCLTTGALLTAALWSAWPRVAAAAAIACSTFGLVALAITLTS